ncbi:hypothetical protein [Pelomonas sp. SE-A7]|uniref:hypothetical protein n=1 Tax=Pelomonas sp. SE-A7 TaxID=3054953 RepID=UPI00259CD94A|nr:hypothetical protein [Pelomonas sp. SE-A7]MDM4767520.1 hypothetical protein [Pelomonas sp. SE-A7]
MTALAAQGGSTPELSSMAAPEPRRSLSLLLFIVLSMLVAMSIDQKETPEVGSFAYLLLVVPSLLLPLTEPLAVARALLGRARPILIFGIVAGGWHLMRGDLRAVQQLVLIVLVLGWLSTDRARLATNDLVRLYLALVVIGAFIWLQSDFNIWGLLPGFTVEDAALSWRVSFFPNIANTAVLSLALVLLLTRTWELAKRHTGVLLLATYFLLFSFVRTASIGLALYAFMRWWLGRKPRSARASFWMALGLGVGINLLIASSVFIVNYLQQFELISRLFLRSESDLTPEEIYAQLYRPWLWMQHLELFWTSPSMMGLGFFEFVDVQIEELNVGTTPAGNEAQLTRLLATYGLPGALYSYFFIARLREAARLGDHWGVACFPTFVLLMMQWGSIFHPSDANGALFTLIAIHGNSAFLPLIRRPLLPAQAQA